MEQKTVEHSFRFSIMMAMMRSGRMSIYGVQPPDSDDYSEEINACAFHHILTYRRPDGQILAIVDIFAQEKIIIEDAEYSASAVLGLNPSVSVVLDEWDFAFFTHPWDEILGYVERAYLDMVCE